jgi:Ca2+-binding EF-hand superfamily protein
MTQSDMRKTEFKALVSHLCQSYPEEVINFVIQKAEQSFETLNWTFFLTFIGAMVRETGMDKLLNGNYKIFKIEVDIKISIFQYKKFI